MEWLVPILDAVLGSLVRSALMMITGFLIERHLVSQEIANQFVSDGVAHVLIAVPAALALAWSVWVKVRGRARFLTALEAAPGTTEEQVKDKVDAGMGVSVKAGAIVLACALAGAAALSMPSCASLQPPPGTYDAPTLRTRNADEAVKALQALSDTAINMNAAKGAAHLSDLNTSFVRDFVLSAGAGLAAWGNGTGTLDTAIAAFEELARRLSAETALNDRLRFALALVGSNLYKLQSQP